MAKKKSTKVEKQEAVKQTTKKIEENKGAEIFDVAVVHVKGAVKGLQNEFGDKVIKAAMEQVIKEELE